MLSLVSVTEVGTPPHSCIPPHVPLWGVWCPPHWQSDKEGSDNFDKLREFSDLQNFAAAALSDISAVALDLHQTIAMCVGAQNGLPVADLNSGVLFEMETLIALNLLAFDLRCMSILAT